MGVCVGVNTTAWMGRWRLTLQPGRVPSQPEVWLLTRLESKVCRHHPTKCIIFLPWFPQISGVSKMMSHEAQGNVSGAQPRWVAEQSTADTHGMMTQCKGNGCLCGDQPEPSALMFSWRKQPQGVLWVFWECSPCSPKVTSSANETQIMIQVF